MAQAFELSPYSFINIQLELGSPITALSIVSKIRIP